MDFFMLTPFVFFKKYVVPFGSPGAKPLARAERQKERRPKERIEVNSPATQLAQAELSLAQLSPRLYLFIFLGKSTKSFYFFYLAMCIFDNYFHTLPVNSCLMESKSISTRNLSDFINCPTSVRF